MTSRNLQFVAAFAAAMLGSSFSAWCEDANQAALLKAMSGAKVSLAQGIAQVAKGTEVPTEAKYEMDDGKLMLSAVTGGQSKELASVSGPGEFNGFVWIAGGTAILLSESELWLVPIDGGPRRQIDSRLRPYQMSVNPRQNQLAFTSGTFRSEVWRIENFLPVTQTAPAPPK